MNRNPTGISPKNPTHNRSNTSTSNISYPTLKTKNVSSPSTNSTSSYKSSYNTTSSLQSNKNIVVTGTDRNTRCPTTSTTNHTTRIAIKTSPLPTTLTTPSSDNTLTADTIVPHININTSTNDQPINSSLNTTNNSINFASAVAMEKTPSREQALVFNSIDGIPQKEYILAIGKIVSPKNITFISRISNNRFCVFLSSKQILDNLMQTTQSININDQNIPIRRLLNPAKRFIISNVCPSIPNQAITDALKNIDILPISQINHLKAGINIEGYEHIMSFRRQIYLKHEDIPKLPNSLLITQNESQFRIFFTDDKITCFLCKATGHTTNNCKNNVDDKSKNMPIPSSPNKLNKHEDPPINHTELMENTPPPTSPQLDIPFEKTETDWTEDTEENKFFSSTLNHPNDTLLSHTPNETHKRLM
uniref:Transposon TX1 uncharacterized protein n=1 Tax=Sipha flava TaxID=143950 RepID=A0A2S2QA68_9HEMI